MCSTVRYMMQTHNITPKHPNLLWSFTYFSGQIFVFISPIFWVPPEIVLPPLKFRLFLAIVHLGRAPMLTFFISILAAGIIRVPQNPLVLPQATKTSVLSSVAAVSFSIFYTLRLFTVNTGQWPSHGINWLANQWSASTTAPRLCARPAMCVQWGKALAKAWQGISASDFMLY